jgi:hypothetical protein
MGVCPMQVAHRSEKLIVMAKQAPNPESISDLRHEVRGLNQIVEGLRKDLENKEKKSLWDRAGENKVIAGLIVAAIVAVCGWVISAVHSQANEFVDGHIKQQIKPIATQVTAIDERTSRIEGAISVLRGQFAVTKYSEISKKELKGHQEELKVIKNDLSKTPQNIPNYWPASFQIITLFSQAQFQLETIGKRPLSIMSNVRYLNVPNIIGFAVQDKNVLLENLVEGVTFTNSVVHFDPSVRLVNDTFINCVFVFPVGENPSKPLQEIGHTLLASDLSKVTLNAS